jgi:beta-glucanase (GH16 family)
MKFMHKQQFQIGSASAALLLLVVGTSQAQSSAYFQAVTNLHPVAYWPLQETNPPPAADVEINHGSLGAVANAYYNDSSAVQPGAPGAIFSEPGDSAVSFNDAGDGGFLAVPTTDQRVSVPVGPFTVEAWVRPTDYSNYVAIVSQAGPNPGGPSGSNSRGGWVLSQNYQAYADSNGLRGWSFHVYNNQGAANNSLQGGAEAGVPFNYQLNTWYHLVGVFDGTNCTLYVNGTNETSAGYQIPMSGSYVPDTWDPLCIGCGRGLNANRFGGSIDEVAIYTNALTAAQVLNHYNAGVSASPATPYEDVVENDHPYMYWRMDAPAYTTPDSSTYPVATNYGSLNDVHGLYYPGTLPGMPGPFGPSSYACAINGLDAGIVVGGSPVDPVLNSINRPVTVMLWFKSNPADSRFQILAGHGDIGSHSWRLALDKQGYLRWNAGEGVIYSSEPIYNDGNWHFVVASYMNGGTAATGTNYLYVNGVLDTNSTTTGSNTGDAGNPILGGDPDSVNTGPSGYSQVYAAAEIAQVAVFTNGLSAAQVQTLYSPPQMPPFILSQPTTDRVDPGPPYLYFGVRASGAAPLAYQWYFNTSSNYTGATKLTDGAKYAGSATAQLTVSNLMSGDSGYYFVVVTNDYGTVTSELSSLQVDYAPYYLVWHDEFNGASLDGTKWDYWPPLGPQRLAINTPNAVSFNGSNLVITTYTSSGTNYAAAVSTEGEFRSRYGYWEASIKWSDTNGEWSAFWMESPTIGLNLNDPQTSGSEIDMPEHRLVDGDNGNAYIANQADYNLHLNYLKSAQNFSSGLVDNGLASGFHTYGFLWTPGSYLFSIDGDTVYTFSGSDVSHSCEWIVLDSEISDGWEGTIPAGGFGNQATSGVKLTVDYVRYYAPMTTLFWTGTNSVYLTNSANWVANRTPTASSDLTFSYLSGGNLSPMLGQNLAVDSLVFLNTFGGVSVNGTNTLTLGTRGIDMVAADEDVSINCPVNVGANQTWAVGPNYPGNLLVLNGKLSGSAALTTTSYGSVTLADASAYTGPLTVAGGSLIVNGALAASSVNVTGGTPAGPGEVLSIDGVPLTEVSVTGGTLAGDGVITGPVTVQTGGTLSPGSALGALTISNSLSLAGATVMEINAAAHTGDSIRGLTSVNYGGTLTVDNQAGTPEAGDQFKLFDAASASGNFTTLYLPPLDVGLAWDFDPGSGVLWVVDTTPPTIATVVSGNNLSLSWPADHTGWTLQAQTNSLSTGIGTNWVDVAGSAATNQVEIPIDPTNGAVFYRMIYHP